MTQVRYQIPNSRIVYQRFANRTTALVHAFSMVAAGMWEVRVEGVKA